MKEISVWDIIAWVVLAGIFLWLILKVLGIINTSTLLEYAPLFGVAYLLGWNVHKLNNISNKIENFDKFKEETVKEINHLKLNCAVNHQNKR